MDPLRFGEEAIEPAGMDTALLEGEVDENGRARITGIVEDEETKARNEEAAARSAKRRGMRLMEDDPSRIPEEIRKDFFQDQCLVRVDASLYDGEYHPDEFIRPEDALTCKDDFDYVIPGLTLGDMGLLVAPGGVGKSSLAMYYAIKIAMGEGGLSRGGVLMIAAEDDEQSAKIRLREALQTYPVNTDPSSEDMNTLAKNLLIWPGSGKMCDVVSNNDTNSNRLQWKIYNSIEKHPWRDRPRLIIFDTLRRVAPIVENSNDEMSLFVQIMEKIARVTRTAVLVLHHASKSTVINGNAGVQQAARGGSALVDNARFCSHLLPMTAEEAEANKIDDNMRKKLVKYTVSKCNRGPTPPELWFMRMKNGVLVPTKAIKAEVNAPVEYGGNGMFWGIQSLDHKIRKMEAARTGAKESGPANRRPPKRDDSNVGGLLRNRPVGGQSPEASPETPGEEKSAITPDQVATPETRPEPVQQASPASAVPARDAAPETRQDLSMLALPAGSGEPAIGQIRQEKSE